ncbi:MAG: hypothetical protein QOG43_484 [Actinomycetota bacterium]|nr:hypothetical protein [Actinomycetota bacterium]
MTLFHGSKQLDFAECPKCRQVFIVTPVTDEELSAAYATIDAASYYETVAETSAAKARVAVDDLLRMGLERPTVVDLGCGGGHFLRMARDAAPGWTAVGYDIDSASVDLCRAAGLIATTSLAELPRADVVTMLDVAEHVKDQAGLFAEAARLLGPGGRLYIHTPRRCVWDSAALLLVRASGLRGAGMLWLQTRVSIYHLRLWSDESLRQAVTAAGFTIESFERELELSWPLRTYVDVYLGEKIHAPRLAIRAADLAVMLFVRLRMMRNKAIVTARRA